MEIDGHVERMGEKGKVHITLVGKPQEKRSLGWHRNISEDNTKMVTR